MHLLESFRPFLAVSVLEHGRGPQAQIPFAAAHVRLLEH